MRKIFVPVALAVSVLLLVSTAVLAAVAYRAPLTITENISVSHTMLPVWVASNNQWLADNGFMLSSGNDTTVETLGGLARPHLVVDNMTLTAVPVPANSQTNLYFTTGGTASATPFKIMTGVGGYITRTDVAAWEPGDNFDMEWDDVYLNLTGTGDNLTYKEGAYRVYDSGNEALTASIYGANSLLQTSQNASDRLYTGNYIRAGQRLDAVSERYITQVDFLLQRALAPVGTGYARVRAVSDDSILATLGSIDVATINNAAPTWYSFNTTAVSIPDGTNIRISFEYSGGDAANYISFYVHLPSVAVGQYTRYIAGWADVVGDDAAFRLYYTEPDAVITASGISVGEHTLITYADSANLTIDIDGSTENSTVLGGASVPDNGNNWILGGNAFPYFASYSHSVGGAEVSRYEPSSMIIGTNLPDTVASNNGTITWGANPTGVTVAMGSMVATSTDAFDDSGEEETNDILPAAVGQADFNVEPDISGALLTNPLRPFVTMLSDSTTLTESQAWRFLGIVFVLFCLGATGRTTHWHPLATGVGTGAAIVLLVVMTVFPLIALLVAILAIIGGIVFKRSPTL